MNIGILGGTFDPIHKGHLAIAEHILEKFKLDRIDFIPSFLPPHRAKPAASPEHRLKMLQLAVQNNPAFSVNEIELFQKQVSYTINTITALQHRFPKNHYFYIIGADAFSQFHTWREWEKIISIIDVIIVSRYHFDITLPKVVSDFVQNNQLDHHIHFCFIEPIAISATQVRADLAAKKSDIPALTEPVLNYIKQNGLYTHNT